MMYKLNNIVLKNTFAVIFMLIVAYILYFPTINNEIITENHEFKTISEMPDLDYFFHNDSTSITIAENSLECKYEFQDKKCSFSVNSCDLQTVFKNQIQFDNNTHELYAQSLSILFDLVNAYKATGNRQFLKKGFEIIYTWDKYNKRFSLKRSLYSWNDHSVALRTIALLYFFDTEQNIIEYDNHKIQNILNTQLKYLLNDNNYSFKGNHGVFQDIALLYLSRHLKNKEALNKFENVAISRFEDQIDFAITNEGFHLENSPHYQFVITELIKSFLSMADKTKIKDKIKKKYSNAKKVNNIMILADKKFPKIGDTDHMIEYPNVETKNANIISNKAGYYIYKQEPQIYFLARTQSILRNHIHNDASSFVLYLNSQEIISEAGFLNYNSSWQRDYIKSKYAHNTLYLANSVSDIWNIGSFKANTIDGEYFFLNIKVQGDLSSNRYFIYDSKMEVLIIADFYNTHENIERKFILADSLNIIKSGKDEILLSKSNRKYFISSNCKNLELSHGEEKKFPTLKAIPYDSLYNSSAIYQSGLDSNSLFMAISLEKPISFIKTTKKEISYIKDDHISEIKILQNQIKFNNTMIPLNVNTDTTFAFIKRTPYWLYESQSFKIFIIIFVLTIFYYKFLYLFLKKTINCNKFSQYLFYSFPYIVLLLLIIYLKSTHLA